jgi:hypothetical protein
VGRKTYTVEQIIGKPREAEGGIGEGDAWVDLHAESFVVGDGHGVDCVSILGGRCSRGIVGVATGRVQRGDGGGVVLGFRGWGGQNSGSVASRGFGTGGHA